ncbi:hypothetical protein KY358_01395 [Candidatus Woesearchaeota archaeon]|nr:hypothetical protein [Candidatus Woesearchaeota archaeon]
MGTKEKKRFFGFDRIRVNSKRGQLLYKVGIEIIVTAIVILTFQGLAYSYGYGDAIPKIRAAKDIGLMIEQMYLVPNGVNTITKYPEDVSNMDIIIRDYTVSVSSTADDVTESTYAFAGSSNYAPLTEVINKPKELYVGKIAGEIIVSEKKPDLRRLKCEEIAEKPKIKSILVDSGIGKDQDIEKGKAANLIAASFMIRLGNDIKAEHARNEYIEDIGNNPLSLAESRMEDKVGGVDAVIRIQVGERESEGNNIRIYFSPKSPRKEEIKKMGCLMINNILKNDESGKITGAALVPQDGEPMLDNDKIAMVIEIDNYAGQEAGETIKPDWIDPISLAMADTLRK